MTETNGPKERVLFMPKQLATQDQERLRALFNQVDFAYQQLESHLGAIAGELGPERGAFFLRMAEFEEQNRLQLVAQRAEALR